MSRPWCSGGRPSRPGTVPRQLWQAQCCGKDAVVLVWSRFTATSKGKSRVRKAQSWPWRYELGRLSVEGIRQGRACERGCRRRLVVNANMAFSFQALMGKVIHVFAVFAFDTVCRRQGTGRGRGDVHVARVAVQCTAAATVLRFVRLWHSVSAAGGRAKTSRRSRLPRTMSSS